MVSYRDAGVDLEGAGRHVSRITPLVESTWSEAVVGGLGGFAAGVEIPPGYQHPVMMMTTDGVGTKLDLARRLDRWAGVGFDLVAMCVDDLATVGARPLGLVDYLAVGALHHERDAAIVEGIARACSEAGCPLLGGETAEHPGVMEPDAVDLAGAAVGVVEKGEVLGPHRVREEDVVVGLYSPNLRSNGFSLIRALFGDDCPEVLLEPSVIYGPSVLDAIATGGVHAAAHVTGGGIRANLARVLPNGLGAVVDTETWSPPEVFGLVAAKGVSIGEMFSTFNMGIGFCLVVDPAFSEEVMASVGGHEPTVIGHLVEGSGVDLT